MSYKEAFYLKGKRGNNAFSYEKRVNLKLFVPSLIEGSFADVQLGKEIVFEDEDENGELQSCSGLKNFIRTEFEGTSIVIVDNHNHVLFFWYEALSKGLFSPGAVLIHVDQHKDMRKPVGKLKNTNLDEVFRYTNEVVNVGNYIVPAQEQGLIGEIVFVTSELSLDDERFMDEKNKILNIDLDFFAPELSYISFEKAKLFIRKHAKTAALITVATSPFFIDQNLAISKLKELFG